MTKNENNGHNYNMKNIKLVTIIFLMLLFSSYGQDNSGQINIGNEEMETLNPMSFKTIEEVNSYISKTVNNNNINYNDVLSNLYENYKNSGYSGLMADIWLGRLFLADLDEDGIYELYLNGSAGSGIIHFYIHGYNPRCNKYYIISKRMETDYIFFIYKNLMYVWSKEMFINNEFVIYKPVLINDELILKNIEKDLQNEIIENIRNPWM